MYTYTPTHYIHMHIHICKYIVMRLQTKWMVLLFLFMCTKYPHANILPESIHRLDAAIHFITPTHLHSNGRLRPAGVLIPEIHALTRRQEAFQKATHLYLYHSLQTLFKCVWYHLVLSSLCTFSTHCNVSVSI